MATFAWISKSLSKTGAETRSVLKQQAERSQSSFELRHLIWPVLLRARLISFHVQISASK